VLTSPHLHIARHGIQTAHIVGLPISDFSRYIIKQLAGEAHLQIVHITSVRRTVVDQARIFYNKHIVEGKVAKNVKTLMWRKSSPMRVSCMRKGSLRT